MDHATTSIAHSDTRVCVMSAELLIVAVRVQAVMVAHAADMFDERSGHDMFEAVDSTVMWQSIETHSHTRIVVCADVIAQHRR